MGGAEVQLHRFFRATGRPFWRPRWRSSESLDFSRVGALDEDLEAELWIWRPILAGKCTLEGVLNGVVGIDELVKLNALLDMSAAVEGYQHEQAMKKAGR